MKLKTSHKPPLAHPSRRTPSLPSQTALVPRLGRWGALRGARAVPSRRPRHRRHVGRGVARAMGSPPRPLGAGGVTASTRCTDTLRTRLQPLQSSACSPPPFFFLLSMLFFPPFLSLRRACVLRAMKCCVQVIRNVPGTQRPSLAARDTRGSVAGPSGERTGGRTSCCRRRCRVCGRLAADFFSSGLVARVILRVCSGACALAGAVCACAQPASAETAVLPSRHSTPPRTVWLPSSTTGRRYMGRTAAWGNMCPLPLEAA